MNPMLSAAWLGVFRGWTEFRQSITNRSDQVWIVMINGIFVAVLYFQRDNTVPGTDVSLALATLLGWQRMLTRVVVAYTLTCLPIFYLHHYWSWNTPSSLIFLYVVPPLALPVIGWLYQRLAGERDRPAPVGAMLAAPSVSAE